MAGLYCAHCGTLQGNDRSPISTVRLTLVIYSAYRLRITLGQRPVGSGLLTGVLVVSPIFSVGLLLKKVTLWGCCTENVNDPRRAVLPSASAVRSDEGVVPQLLSLFIYLFLSFFRSWNLCGQRSRRSSRSSSMIRSESSRSSSRSLYQGVPR